MYALIALALVQSLTEFLPISSSGHLVLLEKFGITHQTLVLDVALHLGTLLAVCTYFARDLKHLFKGFFIGGAYRRLLIHLMIATVPVIFVGFFLKNMIEHTFRSILIIAVTSAFYGLLLWYVDAKKTAERSLREMTNKEALWIGCAQVLALIPGTSRSGITMTCARWLQFNRSESARFSMLLSIPTVFLAAVYVLYCAVKSGEMTTALLSQVALGIGLSALFGFAVIWFLMTWVKRASFALFGIYRLILSLCLIGYILFKGVF